jgi:small-conductance mechanosensitive channel
MTRCFQALQLLLLLLFAPLARAQSPPDSNSGQAPQIPNNPLDTAAAVVDESLAAVPLIVGVDTVATFRATLRGTSPARRAEMALDRIEALAPQQMLQPIRIEPLAQGQAVLVGDLFAFLILDADVDSPSGQTSAQVAQAAGQKLGHALSERARLMSAGQRLRSFIEAIIGTLVAMVLILVLFRISRLALKWMQSKSEVHRQRLRLGDMDLMDKLSILLSWIAKLLTQIGALAVVTLWVIFVLNRFPETQRWGFAARSSLIDILQTFEKGLLRAIPGILAVILIIVVARFVSRIVGDIFSGVERGSIRFPGVHPETAGATRRLVNVLIWMFAIVVAYPLIPGSDSAAFQGVSVFLGLIVTLGSSGIVGHMMSGLVVVYSRALQKGDYIRVGDIEGIVSEVGTLSIKVANAKKEEFTIPNTVIVGNIVKNYSRLTREAGIPVTTSVTIGYDAPWRVVQEMLVAAAERTPGVYKSPAPIVLQTKLSEFFVEYQLIVRLEPPALPIATLNLLHQNIQDIFNERGVQIMVPAFESQPERPIVIPKSKWNQAPGDRQA